MPISGLRSSGKLARHVIEWHWVRGHSGDAGNEAADALANQAIDELRAGQ